MKKNLLSRYPAILKLVPLLMTKGKKNLSQISAQREKSNSRLINKNQSYKQIYLIYHQFMKKKRYRRGVANISKPITLAEINKFYQTISHLSKNLMIQLKTVAAGRMRVLNDNRCQRFLTKKLANLRMTCRQPRNLLKKPQITKYRTKIIQVACKKDI